MKKIILILSLISFLLPATSFAEKFMGRVTNGKEPKYQTEEYKHRYSISCVSNADNPSVFNSIEKQLPFKSIQFKKGTDMAVDQIVTHNNKQYLVGTIHVFAGSRALRVARDKNTFSSDEEKYKLYVLSKDWDCFFYKGDREVSHTCDTMVKHLIKQNKVSTQQLKENHD